VRALNPILLIFFTQIPQIFEDILENIIRDTVMEVHRSEKMLRMTSIAVQAERIALQASGAPPTPTTANPANNKPILAPVQAPQITIAVPGGQYENGKVFLKGNPLKQVKDIYCPHCKLPRLLFPATGVGSRLPDDPNQQYCTLHPFIQKPGHDIYGNPFPIDQTNKTKRERELIKKAEKAERENTPGSQDTNEDGVTSESFAKRLMAGGKPASYVPWHTCPLCKRSLLITKFAQHLEKCLGIGGRAARNTAAARLSGMNGSASGSVQGSRVGTPTPSSQGNGKKDADDDDDEGPPKKKAKKDASRKERRENGKEKVIIKLGGAKSKGDANNRSSKSGAPTSNPDRAKGDDTPTSKRERQADSEEAAAPRKKMKLSTESSVDSP
jgi:ribonuclease P/MRP protein subunit POP1